MLRSAANLPAPLELTAALREVPLQPGQPHANLRLCMKAEVAQPGTCMLADKSCLFPCTDGHCQGHQRGRHTNLPDATKFREMVLFLLYQLAGATE